MVVLLDFSGVDLYRVVVPYCGVRRTQGVVINGFSIVGGYAIRVVFDSFRVTRLNSRRESGKVWAHCGDFVFRVFYFQG